MALKRARSTLTEPQAAFVAAKLEGLSDTAAGRAAGAASGSGFVNSVTVKEALAAARRWLTDTTQIKRLDVIEGMIDGIEMARMQGDSGNVIKGWSEVAKLLGYYAPEVKRIELSAANGRLRAKFEALSDEELLQIAQGASGTDDRGIVLDGECKEIQ